MKFIPFILFFTLILCSCKSNRKIIIRNLIFEGNISDDTIYNGLINEYDANTKVLLAKSNYINGELEGERITYNKTGSILTREYYKNNKLNEDQFFYNNSGNIKAKQYYYYDLKVGPSIEYVDGNVAYFSYSSLDNKILFSLNYDSLKFKRIIDLVKDYFFFYQNSYVVDIDSNKKDNEVFLYLIHPPKFDFAYSIVHVDSAYNYLSTVHNIASHKKWYTFPIDDEPDFATHIAVRLVIYDSIRREKFTMFKKLN